MTRLEMDLVMAASGRIVATVGHHPREEEKLEMFGIVKDIIAECLLRRAELLARERKRLGKPTGETS